MIQFLQKTGGYTSNGLTMDEKKELEKLRLEVKKYRDMEGHAAKVNKEETNDLSDKSDEDEVDSKLDNITTHKLQQRISCPRAAVSAEAYGVFNKKEDFKARIIKKSEEQIQRIKARIVTSFLFGSLEQKDLDVRFVRHKIPGCLIPD